MQEAGPSSEIFKRKTSHFCSDFSFLYFSQADHHGEIVSGLLGSPLSFPFHVLSSSHEVASCAPPAMSFLPETRRDGGLLPQMPCASLARPNAEPPFFLPIFKYQGSNLNGHLLITYQPLDLSFSLCSAQGNDVLGHICISCPPTLT